MFNIPAFNSQLGWLTEWDGLDAWSGNICQSAQTSRLNWLLSIDEKHLTKVWETFEKYLKKVWKNTLHKHRVSTSYYQPQSEKPWFLENFAISAIKKLFDNTMVNILETGKSVSAVDIG